MSALAAATLAAIAYAEASPAPATEHASPYTRETEIWQLRYYRGHYYQTCITRKSGSRHVDYTLRGAYVHQPIGTWKRGTGVVPFIWCGPQVAIFQTFTYDTPVTAS